MTRVEWIEQASDDVMIPIRIAKEAIRELQQHTARRWVSVQHAAEIIGMGERRLRRTCLRWEREQQSGRTTQVRVRRRGDAQQSGWLLDEEDVRTYARDMAEQPTTLSILGRNYSEKMPESIPSSADDPEAIAAGIVRRHFS